MKCLASQELDKSKPTYGHNYEAFHTLTPSDKILIKKL